jgi:hypothetical protein
LWHGRSRPACGASRKPPEESAALQRVRDRAMTGREFVIEECDGKMFPAMLNPEGSAFAQSYYEHSYSEDYGRILTEGLASEYAVEDSWANYDRMAEVIAQRYAEAKAQAMAKPWWKFW